MTTNLDHMVLYQYPMFWLPWLQLGQYGVLCRDATLWNYNYTFPVIQGFLAIIGKLSK